MIEARLRPDNLSPAHVVATVFTGGEGQGANAGTITLRAEEWIELGGRDPGAYGIGEPRPDDVAVVISEPSAHADVQELFDAARAVLRVDREVREGDGWPTADVEAKQRALADVIEKIEGRAR